jgi:D-arabinose 1-dehydrogenase-like Zn-dependent alcohol dehydrogenase
MGYRLSRGVEKEAFAKQLGAKYYIHTRKSESGGAVELQKLGGAVLILTRRRMGMLLRRCWVN